MTSPVCGEIKMAKKPINEYEYEEKVKSGMERDPEIENMFREQAERPLQEEYNSRHWEHR